MGKFVFADDVMSVLEIGYTCGTNVMLYGPAGHGKSEMVQSFFEEKGLEYGNGHVFVKSLNGDTDEASLFGGLNFTKLNDREAPDLQYHLERSFMTYPYAVFEEIFDAPASVVCALKDTLTSKRYRGGEQTFKLETQMVVGITNKSPNEISDLGPSHHALIERFPLQYEIKWSSYKSGDYMKMMKSLDVIHEKTQTICNLAGEAYLQGHFISPRTAVTANKLCNNGFGVTPLKFMPGFKDMFAEIARLEQENIAISLYTASATQLRKQFKMLPEYSGSQCSVKKGVADNNARIISSIGVPSNMTTQRDNEVIFYQTESLKLKALIQSKEGKSSGIPIPVVKLQDNDFPPNPNWKGGKS